MARVLAETGWRTPAGITISSTTEPLGDAATVRHSLENALNTRPGMLLYLPSGRAVGYVDPPLEISVRSRQLTARALSPRGRLLLRAVHRALASCLPTQTRTEDRVDVALPVTNGLFSEEERTRQVAVFNAIRAVVAAFAVPGDPLPGLYGAFGYDLIFHVEPIALRLPRPATQRDLVLHLPDELIDFDFNGGTATRHRYTFGIDGEFTADLPNPPLASDPVSVRRDDPSALVERDHRPGEYARLVELAKERFRAGDLFEVVPSQTFRRRCDTPPAEVFRWLREHNPAPHSLLVNLGEDEHLVGASPEFFVQVADEGGNGRLSVHTSPISGTIARGGNALEDAAQIRTLLNSVKDESELTMCTDVDRNDKARVCLPGTVTVTARRRIEMYATLIHTVDNVRGVLRPDRDALDAFTSHLWAVTVTGAPKRAAIEFIEEHERSPRGWYGGAVGRIGFDGCLHTVLTLRTIHLRAGVAAVRAGATLLYESVPGDEERETELKASALLAAVGDRSQPLRRRTPAVPARAAAERGLDQQAATDRPGAGLSVLLVDHNDSFVHCLADYCRQTGATVVTWRAGPHLAQIERMRPDLLVLSPGPGRPEDFHLHATLAEAQRLGIPVFGVCLGLQGMVEFLGGQLDLLPHPVHGKPATVRTVTGGGRLLAGLPETFEVGRYHSLYASLADVPAELMVTAHTDDGVVMAAEHRHRPLAGVQFHPESVMTARGDAGHRIMANVMSWAAEVSRAGQLRRT